MNTRIKELYNQTNLHRNNHTIEQHYIEIEKFAGLIVRECISYIDSMDYSSGSEGIAEYFGIE